MEQTKRLLRLAKVAIEQGNKIVCYGRKQNYYQAAMEEQKILQQVGEILSLCACLGLEDVIQEIQQALLQIMEAKEIQDFILVTDYYELLLLPVLRKIIELGRECENSENYWQQNQEVLKKRYPEIYDKVSKINITELLNGEKYQLEDTMSGEKNLYLRGERKKVYFHSNNNPKEEAGQLAEAFYEKCNTRYHVLGLGLGYLAEALLQQDSSSRFVIYEADIQMVRLMCECRDCQTLLDNERIELVYDEGYQSFLSHLSEGHTVFHEPSLHNIAEENLFLKLYDYYITIQSAVNQRKRMEENFICNLCHKDESVEVLQKDLEGKRVYVIAGGPSLDKTLEFLKKTDKDEKLVCVGTSVKKLKNVGIIPDYMIVTDPMPWMKEQVTESKDIPLWYLSTSFFEVRNMVKQGYLILQKGYEPAEEYGKQQGYQLYNTGGSVTTTALDILLSMGCKEIVCMGMDMAYTDNKSHASDTAFARKIEVEHTQLIPVKGVLGNTLYAPKNLNIYRKWIENRVTYEKNMTLINVSDGAYINGMKNVPTNEWKKN